MDKCKFVKLTTSTGSIWIRVDSVLFLEAVTGNKAPYVLVGLEGYPEALQINNESPESIFQKCFGIGINSEAVFVNIL